LGFYSRELERLKKKGLFRERKIYGEDLIDLASNDYLGLSKEWGSFNQTVEEFRNFENRSPRASMLVNGYSEIHKNFEERMAQLNNFESGLVVGSGFLANFGLIEALVRKGDALFMDSEYHASGVVATRCLEREQIHLFSHNSMEELETLLKNSTAKRKIVAVEGIYSMSGDIVPKEIFDLTTRYSAILLVDEAHSFGVVGENLLGVFDRYGITPQENHIKMGTLGKAIGGYGAYILSSKEIISFLENRSKPVIYSTAPSLFETLLSLNSINSIWERRKALFDEVSWRREFFREKLKIDRESLIFPIEVESSDDALQKRDKLLENSFIVGAIRPPTVQKPILRVIPNLGVEREKLSKFIEVLQM
jgi:8-amino-7-oxononanoate synthase